MICIEILVETIRILKNILHVIILVYKSGNSSGGRASASQAEGREFKSRFPLHFFQTNFSHFTFHLPFLTPEAVTHKKGIQNGEGFKIS